MSIHPTALVDARAEIDPSVEVGPYCVIDAHVRIDAGCRLHHNVYVTGWTHIGADCVIHPGAIIGHEPQDVKYKGARSYCRIGRNVVMREYVTVHRGTEPESETIVGDNCFLLAGAHVAHNCTLGRGVTLINNVLLAGHVSVADGVTIAGGAVVHQFVRIGEWAMVAGNARVPMDVVPYALVNVEGRIVGVNRVGLRRAGFDAGTLRSIRDAYRILFDRRRNQADRLAALSNLPASPALETIVHFLHAATKRGLAGPARRSGAPVPGAADGS